MRYRIGIIGFGERGRSHFQNLCENFDERAEVVAVSDIAISPGVDAVFPKTSCYRDYHELLARSDVDAVIVATFESAHVEVAIAAMKAGKAVLVEKAVAPSWDEAVHLYRYVRSQSVPFMLALNLRHMPSSKVLKQILDQRLIGRVTSIVCHVNAGSQWGAGCFRRYYHDRRLCGDIVLSKLTHDTDLVHHLLQTRAARVMGYVGKTTFVPKPGAGQDCDHCAITSVCPEYLDRASLNLRARNNDVLPSGGLPLSLCPYTRQSTSHDTAILCGWYENPVMFSFVFTTDGPVYERRYQINGLDGQVSCILQGPTGPSVVVHRTNQMPERWPIPEIAGTHSGADLGLMSSFLEYLDSGSPPLEPESILTSVAVPLGGMESSCRGQEINLLSWYQDAMY